MFGRTRLYLYFFAHPVSPKLNFEEKFIKISNDPIEFSSSLTICPVSLIPSSASFLMPAAPYQPPKNGAKIIIVGGGSFGLSTAHALSLKAKGYDIHVYDREKIPASDAASTGK
jgi:hypothetical protein